MQDTGSGAGPEQPQQPEQLGPVARMMMGVAGHAITSYVHFRALAEVLIEKGVLDRDELESRFTAMRKDVLEQTVDEWFDADIAYHIKMAFRSAAADDSVPAANDVAADGRSD